MTAHLIHIGYPKTGSNFLRRWFGAHPQISFVDGGIAGFRTVYDIAVQAADPRPGVLCRVTSAEGLSTPHRHIGAATIDYEPLRRYRMPEAQARLCASLHDLFPDAVILIVTRGFRSMLVSAYSQYVRSGGDLGFEDFCAPGEAAETGIEDPWNYDYLIGVYEGMFGREKLLLLPYELLRDDPSSFFARIASRMGLDAGPVPALTVNRSISPAAMAWYPRLARLLAALPGGRAMRRHFVRATMENRLDRLAGLLQRFHPRPAPTEAAIPEAVLRAFAGHATRLRAEPLYRPYLDDYLLSAD